jgi:hypothetical protein
MIDYRQAIIRGALRDSKDYKFLTEPNYTRYNSLNPIVGIMIIHAH